ncbi:hypothetical protein J2S08_002142 [Bacillus chungangensis]|uniref:CDP-diacylglycerol--serine O-phosphatidyltransferase n=1 Tax=Bacillus chungangensis TaxID=587633 RepID=A0ABT9WSM8_9BACI|nr:hypothetical protein [Bacillus chungangensis]
MRKLIKFKNQAGRVMNLPALFFGAAAFRINALFDFLT